MNAHDRRWIRQAIVGLLMLPLSLVPFGLYFSRTDEGRLVWAKAETSVVPPRVATPSPAKIAWARAHAPDYTGRVALLAYHGLGSGSAESNGMTISPERFADQLLTLKAAGMNAVTARDVALATVGLAELPPNAYMISFDDGRTDAMLYADPILRELELQATMFVITEAASDSGLYYVDWKALRGYARSGRWDIQSHTAAAHNEHETADGRSLPALTSAAADETSEAYAQRVRDDLKRAARTIEQEIGVPPLAFAYPFGAYGGFYDDRKTHAEVPRVVREAVNTHHIVAFNQDDQGSWRLGSCADDRFGQRRLEVGNWTGAELLDRIGKAAAASPPEENCATARQTGHTDRVVATLPDEVREHARRVARLGDHRPPQEPPTPDIAWTGGVWAATGDAVTGCQAYLVRCVGYPAPGFTPPSLLPGTTGAMIHMVFSAGSAAATVGPQAAPGPTGTQSAGGWTQPVSPPPNSTGAHGRPNGDDSGPPHGGGSTSSPGGGSSTSSPPSGSKHDNGSTPSQKAPPSGKKSSSGPSSDRTTGSGHGGGGSKSPKGGDNPVGRSSGSTSPKSDSTPSAQSRGSASTSPKSDHVPVGRSSGVGQAPSPAQGFSQGGPSAPEPRGKGNGRN